MKLSAIVLAAVAGSCIAEPNQLEKRAACQDDAFYSNIVQNAASASAFCSTWYEPSKTKTLTVLSTLTTVTTVKTVTSQPPPTTVYSIESTTKGRSTVTVTSTQVTTVVVNPMVKRQQEAFPAFIEAYESIMMSSACGCLLGLQSGTSTTITATATQAQKVTTTTTANPATKTLTSKTTVAGTVYTVITTTRTTVSSTSVAPAPTNLIQNPGFENGMTGWRTRYAVSASESYNLMEVTSDKAHSGGYSFLFIEATISRGDFDNDELSQDFTTPDTSIYNGQFYIWIDNAVGETCYLSVVIDGNQKAYGTYSPTGAWQTVTFSFQGTASQQTMDFYVNCKTVTESGDGWWVYVDDFSIVAASA